MKKWTACIALLVCLCACNNGRHVPDVSHIDVQLKAQRFDEDFFALDTSNLEPSLDALQQKYPSFLNDFLYNILALPPQRDSVLLKVRYFLRDYRSIYDSVKKQFASVQDVQQQVAQGLRFVKFYFPNYKLPAQVIYFTGPLEGYGNVLTSSGLAVGLQLYLGKDFSVYHSDYLSEVYPGYQSRRFEAPYIAINCMKNVLDDIYPPLQSRQPLVEQMIESGKRLYVLDQLLPFADDTLKTGYTAAQLKGCYDHEALIWNFFLQNNLLYISDPIQMRDYISDGPKTEALGEAAPGNIGQFVGWQIVKKWMDKNKNKTLQQLLNTPASQLFNEARYKPR